MGHRARRAGPRHEGPGPPVPFELGDRTRWMSRKYPSMYVKPNVYDQLKRAASAQGASYAGWLEHAIGEQIKRENRPERPCSHELREQYVCNLVEEVDKQQRRGNYWQREYEQLAREYGRLRAKKEALRPGKEGVPQERGPSLLPLYGTAAG